MTLPILALVTLGLTFCGAQGAPAEDTVITVRSSIDGAEQPCEFVPSNKEGAQPMLVFLHPWSAHFDGFDISAWRIEARSRGWHFLAPDFRGPNRRPEACGSRLARQDILDAVAHVLQKHPIDERRIYLAGTSGGGHMAMVMAAHAPEQWAAVSEWCGISGLAAWHQETKAAGRKYCKDIEAVVGGAPGSSAAVDRELRYRSPVFHLAAARGLPIDFNAGIHDGHTGSVPVHHTLDAFNAVARARGDAPVSKKEIARLSARQGLDTTAEPDPVYGRVIHFRRTSGDARVTIFEGGHEGIAEAACAWLAQHKR